jgi:hypothetical protein
MKSNNYTVYAHINKINGKAYVGITCQKVKDRWKNGNGYACMKFSRAIKKYGWDNFKHIVIIENLEQYTAYETEKALIAAFDLTNPQKGYNEACGGASGGMTGKHHTDSAKAKISKARKINGFSAEHRKHISEAKRGVKHHAAKKVYQYTKGGEFVREYSYMNEAAELLKIKKTSISACCKGKRPSAGGYVWTYEKRGKSC